MKRYWLFGNVCYYATGGFYDYRGSFDTLEDAIAFGKDCENEPYFTARRVEWWHVFDSVTQTVVSANDERPYGCNDDELPKIF